MKTDDYFMAEALKEAEKSFNEGGIPIGAVLVKDGEILWETCRGYSCAEFGVKTMTFHPGAMPPDYTLPQLRDLIRASLEYLLPYAEKYGVIMCIENAMRPTNSLRRGCHPARTHQPPGG